MRTVKCPIKGCVGFEVTTNHPNVFQHIKNRAKTELFNAYIIGSTKMPHAEWIKGKAKKQMVTIYKVDKFTMNI